MGRSGGCCNLQHSANCTAPPCPSGSCCWFDKDDQVDIFNIDTATIENHTNHYRCEDDLTENCCMTKPLSLFNQDVKCGDTRVCEFQSTIAIPSVYNTDTAFTLLRHDGTVLSWGDENAGGISPEGLSNVVDIFSNPVAFVALKKDGTAVPWGDPSKGGSFLPTSIPGEDPDTLDNIKSVIGSDGAFAAIKTDGTVIAWGDATYGGAIPSDIKHLLVDIVEIVSTERYFAARNKSGQIFIWGNGEKSWDKRDVNKSGSITALDSLNIINFINRFSSSTSSFSTQEEFKQWAEENPESSTLIYDSAMDVNRSGKVTALDALLVINGISIIDFNGSLPYDSGFTNIKKIYSNKHAFAFLRNDGKVFAWGDSAKGGNTGNNQAFLENVKEIYNTDQAFLAHREDNKIVVWGDIDTATNPYSDFYDEVLDVFPLKYAFGISYFKTESENSNVKLTHYYDLIGSAVPNKQNYTERWTTQGYRAQVNEVLPFTNNIIKSYTLASYAPSYDFANAFLDIENNPILFKRDFYSGYYATHFTIEYDGEGEVPLRMGDQITRTQLFASIGQSPDGCRNSHTVDPFMQNYLLRRDDNGNYYNDEPCEPESDQARLSAQFTGLNKIANFNDDDENKRNNRLIKGGKSYVFNEGATAMLQPMNATHRWNFRYGVHGRFRDYNGLDEIPKNNGDYFIFTLGHEKYGGYVTSFAEQDFNAFSPFKQDQFYYSGLFSNKIDFCSVQIYELEQGTTHPDRLIDPINRVSYELPDVTGFDRVRYRVFWWGYSTDRFYWEEGEIPSERGKLTYLRDPISEDVFKTGEHKAPFITNFKEIRLTHEGCHPDYCDQDIK
jgi:hypothetical protein